MKVSLALSSKCSGADLSKLWRFFTLFASSGSVFYTVCKPAEASCENFSSFPSPLSTSENTHPPTTAEPGSGRGRTVRLSPAALPSASYFNASYCCDGQESPFFSLSTSELTLQGREDIHWQTPSALHSCQLPGRSSATCRH